MTPSEFFTELTAVTGWKNQRIFWDHQKYGPKPSHYFVWRFSNRSFIETDDDVDVEETTVRASFFTKDRDEIDNVREQAEALALNNGLRVDSNVYDDYEDDTRYYHFDIDFIFYKED